MVPILLRRQQQRRPFNRPCVGWEEIFWAKRGRCPITDTFLTIGTLTNDTENPPWSRILDDVCLQPWFNNYPGPFPHISRKTIDGSGRRGKSDGISRFSHENRKPPTLTMSATSCGASWITAAQVQKKKVSLVTFVVVTDLTHKSPEEQFILNADSDRPAAGNYIPVCGVLPVVLLSEQHGEWCFHSLEDYGYRTQFKFSSLCFPTAAHWEAPLSCHLKIISPRDVMHDVSIRHSNERWTSFRFGFSCEKFHRAKVDKSKNFIRLEYDRYDNGRIMN